MLAFVLRRVLQSFAVMAIVASIVFGLFKFTGDPIGFMVGQDATLLCFIALPFVLLNLLVDLLHPALDPRLRVDRVTTS